jgi:hypothetical protein
MERAVSGVWSADAWKSSTRGLAWRSSLFGLPLPKTIVTIDGWPRTSASICLHNMRQFVNGRSASCSQRPPVAPTLSLACRKRPKRPVAKGTLEQIKVSGARGTWPLVRARPTATRRVSAATIFAIAWRSILPHSRWQRSKIVILEITTVSFPWR